MADDTNRDLPLARLEATVAAQQRRLSRLERRRRRPRRLLPLALVALLVALVPLSLLAAVPFTDLDPAQDGATGHNPNIAAIANAGITRGCNPPDNTEYCPKAFVTREQMASFLARTAGLGGNPPVANANTAVTANYAWSAERATRADTATNANLLGGQPASFYQPAGQPIANANNALFAGTAGTANDILGYAPNELVRAAWNSNDGAALSDPGTMPIVSVTITAPGPGFVLVTATGDLSNTSTGGCPCAVDYHLARVTAPASTQLPQFATVGNAVGGVVSYLPMAVVGVFPVDAGAKEFRLEAKRVNGTGSIETFGKITALFVPFGATGGATLTEVDQPAPAPRSRP